MQTKYIQVFPYLLTLILVLTFSSAPFFWDTIQFAGKHGSWYFTEGIFSGLLPNHLDSGHLPSFGMYQALTWKLFGKSLFVSHLSMLPFLFLNIYLLYELSLRYLSEKSTLLILAFLSCPFYLGHSILVSPDLILISGFLLTLLGIKKENKKLLIIGAFILSLISLRGFVSLLCLIIYQLLFTKKYSFTKLLSIYSGAILLFVGYQAYHFIQVKWIGFHDDSPWSPSFNFVNAKKLIRNIVVYTWRLLDYGVAAVYLALIWRYFREQRLHELVKLWLILYVVFGVMTLPFEGLINHRYYLPIQVIALFLFFIEYKALKARLILIVLLLISNFIVYPDKVAQGWDSTAAHWPIYKVQQNMDQRIANRYKKEVRIGSAFPLISERQFVTLNEAHNYYRSYDLNQDSLILYSNISNDFSDHDIDELNLKWTKLIILESWGIKMILYKKP